MADWDVLQFWIQFVQDRMRDSTKGRDIPATEFPVGTGDASLWYQTRCQAA